MKKYYARESQLLSEHIYGTASLSRSFGSIWGCEMAGQVAGQLHDLGKYTRAFQDYLSRSIKGDNAVRGEVIHALQGAKYADDVIRDQLVADIISSVVATHHGGLYDMITDGERTLPGKLERNSDRLHYEEAIGTFRPAIDDAALSREVEAICLTCKAKSLNPLFMLNMITKVIFSCVVDADRCNSAGLVIDNRIPDWNNLIRLLDSHLNSRFCDSEIDRVRKRISKQCQQAGSREKGIYTLSVPTGSGKTLSGLRFALEHAREHGLKRIIYVVPYLSVLDQIASTFRDVFNDDGKLILEHHSNIENLQDADDEGMEHYRLLTDRWDSTIILTTMVQYLETIYSNKASRLRKFHNMSESVLVFDEVQALPIKCVHLFNESVNFLRTFGASTILLCTATQPHLHKTARPVFLSEESDIVSITKDEQKIFERVLIQNATQQTMSHCQIAELVRKQIDQGNSVLVILNTKRDAQQVYEECRSMECEKAFLTTNLCPAHRLVIIKRLRRLLDCKNGRNLLCVSTQLIEAGVDVSFDCVIRAGASMDSIIQAAGRCNRNKESADLQPVFVIDVEGEQLSRLPEIKTGKNITARVFREMQGKNLLGNEVIDRFYNYYFYAQKNEMDYKTRGCKATIYSLLSDNPLSREAYRSRNNKHYTGLPSAFRTAADEFSVIDGGQTGIVVPYGDATTLVADFQASYDPVEKMAILRQLQKYTVSVYSHTLERISHAVRLVDDTFYLLSVDYYDEEAYGLLLEPKYTFLNA